MPKGSQAQPPFENYLLYGPTWHKSEGRWFVFLVDSKNKTRTTLSYARYLMSTNLGRRLNEDEHVDHIDGNKSNDAVSNLQLLTPAENNRKSVVERGQSTKLLELRCPWCDKEFQKRRGDTHLVKGGLFTSCSRSCSGKLKRRIQMEGVTPEIQERLDLNTGR